MIPRRTFLLIATPGLAGLCTGRARATPAVRRIGVLGPAERRFEAIVSGLRHGLGEHGYTEGTFEIIDARVPRADPAAAREAAQRLMARRVDVVLAVGSVLARAVRDVSRDMPVVFLTPGDPVAAGLVSSFARPGHGMTGMTLEYPELSAKRVELLREMVPRVRSVLVLYDPDDASPRQGAAAARQAAARLGLALLEHPTRGREDIARGLEKLTSADALLAVPGGLPSGYYEQMIGAAHAARRPTMFHTRSEATHDALASYGGSDGGVARQAVRLIDKIFKGVPAGEIPVERPTFLEFVINLKTARALGLAIPPSLLLRADRVME